MKYVRIQSLIAALCISSSVAMADQSLSKLPEGPHLGMIAGFDDLRPHNGGLDRLARANDLFEVAIDAGMTIGRAQIDWRDLETAPGVYDSYELNEVLEYAGSDGLHIFVTFSSIDTDGLTLPDYLSEENTMPFEGHLLSDPEIETPFLAFLDWFIPELAKHNVWGLALGNEVDTPINDNLITQAEALAHLLAGAMRVRALDPALAVTVTLTGDANKRLPDFTDALLAGLDFVSFNTYCISDWLIVNQRNEWQNVMQRWKNTAGDKQIFIQELGCPTGYGGDISGPNAGRENGLGGSVEQQQEFFDFWLDVFVNDPQYRAATVFQLFDWSPELSRIYEEAFAAEGAALAGARLTEWLATVGMCRWSDTECRPAWDSFLTHLAAIKALR